MKKTILNICFVASILFLVYMVFPLFFGEQYYEIVEMLFISLPGVLISSILGAASFLLWIACLVDAKNNKNNMSEVIILILLNGIYTPIYYYKKYNSEKRNF